VRPERDGAAASRGVAQRMPPFPATPGAVGVWPPLLHGRRGQSQSCRSNGEGRKGRPERGGARRAAAFHATAGVYGILDTDRGWTVFQIPSTRGSYEPFNRASAAQIRRITKRSSSSFDARGCAGPGHRRGGRRGPLARFLGGGRLTAAAAASGDLFSETPRTLSLG
jgi:hypothetical protein